MRTSEANALVIAIRMLYVPSFFESLLNTEVTYMCGKTSPACLSLPTFERIQHKLIQHG